MVANLVKVVGGSSARHASQKQAVPTVQAAQPMRTPEPEQPAARPQQRPAKTQDWRPAPQERPVASASRAGSADSKFELDNSAGF